MKKIFKYVLVIVCSLSAGVVGGYYVGFSKEHNVMIAKLNDIRPLRDQSVSYQFINPLLAYVVPSADQEGQLLSLKNTVDVLIDGEIGKNNLIDASVYFSDLNRGRWIGVSEGKKYNPASTLKVVIMVAYLKDAETNPGILDKKLPYTSDLDELLKKNPFNSVSKLIVNASYSIEDLIDRMIVDSDNGAEFLLLNHINSNSLDSIYAALNITSPEKFVGDFIISPRTYSLFFRIIYSSTYLNRQMSEKALEILSRTTFSQGIVAGLPDGVRTSHKFGEYVASDQRQIKNIELHDCGIVYTSNPYFICIMTKGHDRRTLESVISRISALIYQASLKE